MGEGGIHGPARTGYQGVGGHLESRLMGIPGLWALKVLVPACPRCMEWHVGQRLPGSSFSLPRDTESVPCQRGCM